MCFVFNSSVFLCQRSRLDVDNLKSHNRSVQHVIWPNDRELLVIADMSDTAYTLLTLDIAISDDGTIAFKLK